MGRIFNAVVLLDEPGANHYATMVEKKIKTIETRMRNILPEGEIIICCSNGSMTANKGKALCIVNVGKGRPMTTEDEKEACIESVPGRIAFPLTDWKYFSRKFEFSKRIVSGTFQGIFQIEVPEDVKIFDVETTKAMIYLKQQGQDPQKLATEGAAFIKELQNKP
jgi:hypothetical protein